MKFISFNINGIRAHIHQLLKIIVVHNPDIIGLQETKVDDFSFPLANFENLGYNICFSGQKSYNGVAIFSKKKINLICKQFSTDFLEKNRSRIIVGKFFSKIGEINIINVYFPQGDNRKNFLKFLEKKKFYKNFIKYINNNFSKESHIVIIGDMNISQDEYDIGIGEKNKNIWLKNEKCSFLPEEKKWIGELKSFGLIDTFRKKNPNIKNKFSWFDYRFNSFKKNKGLRIDLILVTDVLFSYCVDVGIDYKIREMKKMSDHAPIWTTFSFI